VCIKYAISLSAEHFEGARMIATGVDSLSRVSEFAVSKALFNWLQQERGFGVRQGLGGAIRLICTRQPRQPSAEGLEQKGGLWAPWEMLELCS
jgi:hypothetical protein